MSNSIARLTPDAFSGGQAVGGEPGIRWWRVKVACGFLLVLGVVLKYLTDTYPTFLHGYSTVARLVVLLGGALVIYHFILVRHGYRQPDASARIVTSGGLFRFVRHPIYLGDMIMYLGLTLLACNFLSLAVLAVALVALVRQACEEDAFLSRVYPAVYMPWARRTRRLIPGIY